MAIGTIPLENNIKVTAYPFGFKTAYEPSRVAINIDLGIPVGRFFLLRSKAGSPLVGQR